MIALVALALAAAPTSADAELVSSLVAAAATNDARLDVLSAADVRNAVDLEAQKAILGCDEASCLLEVAGAMDARLVVHGTLGSLGDVVILTLSVFDTATASAVGRVVVQEAKVDGLAGRIPAATAKLLERAPTPTGATRLRTVILDVKLAAPEAAASPASPASPGGFPYVGVGIGAGVVGAAGLGLALGMETWAALDASNAKTERAVVDANQRRADVQAPLALGGYLVGGVALAAAAAMVVVGSLE